MMKLSFNFLKPTKPKILIDTIRKEHGLILQTGIPTRVHAPNGGYLFSLYVNEQGQTYRFLDKRWGDLRKIPAKRVTWKEPI
jgi:hypothetical protein